MTALPPGAGSFSSHGGLTRAQPGLGRDVTAMVLDGAGSRGAHGADTEALQREDVAAFDQRPGGLVVEIAPLIADPTPLFGKCPPERRRFREPGRARALRSCERVG